ncbi:CHAT domain-containing protein [Scytonema sp. UIC 10036]|uniref:CHAT domain-containing protein n=1 Tax=Scytonema sp. UIC 10036 TaxID=2304196 RepID=UPI0013849DBA|nr:CHAT domain-containing protein [Scytonema sp. UIC 10036]
MLIPHRFLHLLPLHALPLRNKQLENEQRKQNCLLDKFPRGVGYAPSCQLLQLSQNQQRPNFSQLFAIQNPTDDLSYTNLEVETIRSFFAETQVLVKQKATKAALNDNNNFKSANCCHFSCHGDFNLASPLESALILADDERLTLAEIFALSLNQCRIITLSACETGIADPTSISDEYISLPSGFLYAGSPSVVSSLWTVNDLSTALLMIKFYQNLYTDVSVAVSLNQAQCWLRDVTKIQLEEWIAEYELKLDSTLRMQLNRRFQNMLDAQPFQSPFYWAAFCAIGL